MPSFDRIKVSMNARYKSLGLLPHSTITNPSSKSFPPIFDHFGMSFPVRPKLCRSIAAVCPVGFIDEI
jgi:hypothetical protein